MNRLELWEGRLAIQITAARDKEYRVAVWDCSLWIAGCIEAMTGVDIRPAFVGNYTDEASSRVWMRDFAGGGLVETATLILGRFGIEVLPSVRMAQRGDVVILDMPNHDDILGIVGLDGRCALFPAERGLAAIPLRSCKLAWRV